MGILIFFHFQLFSEEADLAKWVDPMIGTDFHGHTFPGATLPFGMVQLSPDNGVDAWDWCSGYHASSDVIVGFSHLHLSGTGIGDLGDISLMPTSKKLIDSYFLPGVKSVDAIKSHFSHENEKATPGYYQVFLKEDQIQVELTSTLRTGLHRYTFLEKSPRTVLFNLGFGIAGNKPITTEIHAIGKDTVAGFRESRGWAKKRKVYFVATFSEPFSKMSSWLGENKGDRTVGKEVKAAFSFPPSARPLLVKVGLSSVSEEGAMENLKAESPGWDFDAIHLKAREAWNEELRRIEVKTNKEELKKVFYTAAYHSYIAPTTFSDIDGRYPGFLGKPMKAEGFTKYSTLSLWDTFRALMPLVELTKPDLTNETIKSMLAQYQETGALPIWELMGNETGTMIGNHSIPIIASAMLKGIGNFDRDLAYEAMLKTVEGSARGMDHYRTWGYIPCEKEIEAVSKHLEYCYDDWCVAQVAQSRGNLGDYHRLLKRSESWRNIYDPSVGFMRGKRSDGSWDTPFDPKYSDHRRYHYCEGNAWQWLWFVPHDIEGLKEAMGGEKKFRAKIDQLFSESSELTGSNPSKGDVTGMIGQYSQGNEPDHHVSYLYNFTEAPSKTGDLVKQILSTLFSSKRDGLCGNDDCGQMSAWFVFSAMGFYPVNPVSGEYQIGLPLFDQVTMRLPNGKEFKVVAETLSEKNSSVQALSLNGKKLDRRFVTYQEVLSGGELKFVMGPP